jgi:hypothetical protein
MNVEPVLPGDQVIPIQQLSQQEELEASHLSNAQRIQTLARGYISRRQIRIDPQQVAPGLMRTRISGNDLSHIGINNVNATNTAERARQQMTLVTVDPRRYQGLVSGNEGLTNPVAKSGELASMVGPSSGALINGGFFSTNRYYEPDLPANTALGPTRTMPLPQERPYDNLSSITRPSRVENFESPQQPGFMAPLTLGMTPLTPGPNIPTNYQDNYALLHFNREGTPRVTPYTDITHQDSETQRRLVESTTTAVTSGPILSRDGQPQFPASNLNEPRYQYGMLRGKLEGNNDIQCPPGALYHASDRNPRSAIIVPNESRQDARVSLLYVVGRGQGGAGMTMPELARTTARLGNSRGDIGLNLDGGNSSLVGTKRSEENTFNYHAQFREGRDSATMILFGERRMAGMSQPNSTALPNPWTSGPLLPQPSQQEEARRIMAERNQMANSSGTCRMEANRFYRRDNDDRDPPPFGT